MRKSLKEFLFAVLLILAVHLVVFTHSRIKQPDEVRPVLLTVVLIFASIAASLGGALILERATSGRVQAPRVSSPPGWKLRRFGELCFSKKTFTHVLEPALSDMQKEHFDALATGHLWRARMALVRGYWAFWSAVAAQFPISLARRVYEVWKVTKTGI